ncbi:hypothetical protein AAHZ94_09090 [Streptomyces sp. HSW2009]|uniref:hypothetical protein n=1 Tax=Streptomyces sp. HSW2009 TaxID=3142890 RepID=UPI0032F06B54
MRRSDDGRRWFAGYLKTPLPVRHPATDRPLCPDHGERMVRVLGRAWICRTCTRRPPGTDTPATE